MYLHCEKFLNCLQVCNFTSELLTDTPNLHSHNFLWNIRNEISPLWLSLAPHHSAALPQAAHYVVLYQIDLPDRGLITGIIIIKRYACALRWCPPRWEFLRTGNRRHPSNGWRRRNWSCTAIQWDWNSVAVQYTVALPRKLRCILFVAITCPKNLRPYEGGFRG